MSSKNSLSRFYFICYSFVVFLFIFIGKLVLIQVFHSDYLTKLASRQHNVYLELPAQRGVVYDRNHRPLAVSVRSYSLFAVPGDIRDKQSVAAMLRDYLGLNKDDTLKRLQSRRHFVWLKRKLSDKQAQFIRESGIKGLHLRKEYRRSYANGPLAAHMLGFVDIDNKGLEGIEFSCNQLLQGEPGYAFFVRDAHQSSLRLENSDKLPVDGYDVTLTIDLVVQHIAERALEKAFEKHNAKGASIVVMDVTNGEVLALANRPTFDPNYPRNFSSQARRNRAICDFFEPGSVFKVVTAAAALEEKAFDEKNKIFCEQGSYRVASHILHDHRPHGWLTFSEVIQQSSNIGTTKIAQQLGLKTVHKYAHLFGFGSLTSIAFPGESPGMLKPLSAYSKTSIGAVPIGQEVAVTALQLAAAISVIANGGLYFQPSIIKEVTDVHNETIQENKSQCLRRVISFETSRRLGKILAGVVEVGTGKMAQSKLYSFAGKTGTAQKINPQGGYSHSNFFATFIGFAPVEQPRIAIAVVFDEPRPYYYGGVVAAPVFKEVAEEALQYIEVNEKINQFASLVENDAE